MSDKRSNLLDALTVIISLLISRPHTAYFLMRHVELIGPHPADTK